MPFFSGKQGFSTKNKERKAKKNTKKANKKNN